MSTDFGHRLKTVREEKGLKREDIAANIGTSAAIIGRYERNERTPSIDIANKIADALEVSLDYLIGKSQNTLKDKKMMDRFNSILNLEPKDKEHILYAIDNLIKAAKLKTL